MRFFIVAALIAGFAAVLFMYRNYWIEIELQEDQQFQGIQLRARLPLYSLEQIYDYSDPKLNLLEAMLLDRLDKGFSGKVAFDLGVLKRFLQRITRIRMASAWEKQMYSLFKKLLQFTVIKKVQWESSVGGRDAMAAALHTGLFWAFKGTILAVISHHSRLEEVQITVKPDFNNSIIFSRIHCILKIRTVHIITIGVYIIVLKVRWWMNGYTARAAEQPSH